jgi:hypothetical protein
MARRETGTGLAQKSTARAGIARHPRLTAAAFPDGVQYTHCQANFPVNPPSTSNSVPVM